MGAKMRKIILSFLILFSAFDIYASSQWVFIGTDSEGDTFFVDQNSIQKNGDSSTHWVITNYSKRDVDGDLSSKIQQTINCRTRESINRFLIFYDDIDNKGKITSNFVSKSGWRPIPPDTKNWAIHNFVCSK